MLYCQWRCIIVVSFVILGIFLHKRKEAPVKSSLPLKEKKEIIWQIVQDQIISKSNNHMEVFKEMKKNCPLLESATYRLLAGTLPKEKKLLTVGISSVQRSYSRGSYLLNTLKSLFQASSLQELETMVVVVHLSDQDPAWLSQTVTSISGLFSSHIEANNLLVIQGLSGGSLLPKENSSSPCGELYSRQKEDYALLMNFGRKLSDYFLLMEDHVRYTPGFVSTIYGVLSAWKEFPWVILEFSSLRFSGKVFHSRDLPHLISLFLLFHKGIPTHLLLSHFCLLLAQNVPIHFVPSIFHHLGNQSELEDTCFPVEKDKVFGEPDNPVAIVLTDMLAMMNSLPQYAYILNEEAFSTLDPVKGNQLTVILDKPHKVTRVAVLTGSKEKGMLRLKQGKVLLGYNLLESTNQCTHYTLLGPLVSGNLDQRVFYEEDSVKELSCIQVMVLASQEYWLMIRQIKVWTEPEEEGS